ncbi:uncharacterized protein LOC124359968 [Homalodisca vitripennis]|uniref:uncharacterized protein LOC124359968 n=1 Tax=Homalodisca vitripennis TaxID=197043 RepID=UPI001EECD0B8|nr:uncharacterized protein LOC124359968 [Homalodisca vitripennis]KAG8259126.1 hypothetical protein J6590_017304 [Homalodisca vitripennis]
MLVALLLLGAGCTITLASPHGANVRLGTAPDQNIQPFQVLGSSLGAVPQTDDVDKLNDGLGLENVGHIRRRRLADDKKLDLKMKMQRVKKVVSMDAIGSYSLYRSNDRRTSLKAFGSTELWYDGKGFGLKKPGLGVQFTIYY